MSQKKKKLLRLATTASLAMLSVLFLQTLGQGQTNWITPHAAPVHDENCIWNHYTETAPTVVNHGVREYWACCSHPGHRVFNVGEVTGVNVTHMGEVSAAVFAEINAADDRYLPSLTEGYDKIIDTATSRFVGSTLDYGGNGNHTAGHLDPTIGYYSESAGINRTDDQICLIPETHGGTPSVVNQDVTIYESIRFWISCSETRDIALRIDDQYTNNIVYSLTANEWTMVEFTPSTYSLTKIVESTDGKFIGLGNWGTFNNVTIRISSVYAKKAATDIVYDAANSIFGDSDYSYPAAMKTSGHTDDATFPYYSQVAGLTVTSDWVWLRPQVDAAINCYDTLYFYVKANQDVAGYGVVDNYAIQGPAYNLVANTWTRITVDNTTGYFTNIKQVGFGRWTDGVVNLTLKFSSIFGVRKGTKLYDAEINYMVPAETVSYGGGATLTPGHYAENVGFYSKAEGINQVSGEFIWFKPASADATDVTAYSRLYFFVRANQDITLSVIHSYAPKQNFTFQQDVWLLVNVDRNDLGISYLGQFGFGRYCDSALTNLELHFSSVYGVV